MLSHYGADSKAADRAAYRLADPPRRGGYVCEVFARQGVATIAPTPPGHHDYDGPFGMLYVADDDGLAALDAEDGTEYQVIQSYGYRADDAETATT